MPIRTYVTVGCAYTLRIVRTGVFCREHSGQRMPTGVGVMQSGQIGLSQLEHETPVRGRGGGSRRPSRRVKLAARAMRASLGGKQTGEHERSAAQHARISVTPSHWSTSAEPPPRSGQLRCDSTGDPAREDEAERHKAGRGEGERAAEPRYRAAYGHERDEGAADAEDALRAQEHVSKARSPLLRSSSSRWSTWSAASAPRASTMRLSVSQATDYTDDGYTVELDMGRHDPGHGRRAAAVRADLVHASRPCSREPLHG